MAAFKVNLTALLDELDKNSLTVYEEVTQDEELKKEIDKALDYTLPLWMTGSTNDLTHRQLILSFDAIANIGWFALRDRQELRMKLLGCIGTGRTVRHKFINSSSAKKAFSNLQRVMMSIYADASSDDLPGWIKGFSDEEFKTLLGQLGYQGDEQKDLLKEFVSCKKAI